MEEKGRKGKKDRGERKIWRESEKRRDRDGKERRVEREERKREEGRG